MVTGYSVPIFHSVSSYIIHEFQKEFVVSGICNNIKSVRWDWPTNMFAINNFFICPQAHPGERHRVLNLYQDMSSRHLQDMSSRRLQDMSSRRLQDVLEDVKLLRWRRVEDVFKTNKCLLGNFRKIILVHFWWSREKLIDTGGTVKPAVFCNSWISYIDAMHSHDCRVIIFF